MNQIAKNKDYLIIGQGMAGTFLARFLLKKGATVLVADGGHQEASSTVGAGIINPITGRRFVKTWKADILIPFAKKEYQALEKEFRDLFFYEFDIIKPAHQVKELNDWLARTADQEIEHYVQLEENEAEWKDTLQPFVKLLKIKGGGRADMEKVVISFRRFLKENDLLIEKKVIYNELEVHKDHVTWNNLQFKKVIFCEGYQVIKNPFFKWLLFSPAKGELIRFHVPDLPEDKIVNRTSFILPIGDQHFIGGATYEWEDLDHKTTPEAKAAIIKKIRKIIKVPLTVNGQWTGIRPSTDDRRPVIGLHPEQPAIGVFNGLGTKAALLAPYFARQFADFLEGEDAIEDEVSLMRFWET